MAELDDKLHIMTKHPTKYEIYRTNNLRGVAFKREMGRTNRRMNR